MGSFLKDKFPGEFLDAWKAAVDKAGFQKVSAECLDHIFRAEFVMKTVLFSV